MCIANLWIEVLETQAENLAVRRSDILAETVRRYPMSVVVGFIAVCFSAFVFMLCGFHTYISCINQTTQELLKGKFADRQSPYSRGSVLVNYWRATVWPPSQIKARLTWLLYLRSNYPEKFQTVLTQQYADRVPEYIEEPQVRLLTPRPCHDSYSMTDSSHKSAWRAMLEASSISNSAEVHSETSLNAKIQRLNNFHQRAIQ